MLKESDRREFDKTKCLSILIKDEKLLEKYNEIWKKTQQHYQKNLYTMKNI